MAARSEARCRRSARVPSTAWSERPYRSSSNHATGLRHTGSPAPAGRNRHASTGPAPLPTRTTRPDGPEAARQRSRDRSVPLDRIRIAAPPRGDRHGIRLRAGSRGKLRHPATDRCRRYGSGTARREDPARTRRGAPPRAGRGPGQSNRPAEDPRTGDPELDGEDVPLVDLLIEDAGVRRDAEQGLDVQGGEPLDGHRLERRPRTPAREPRGHEWSQRADRRPPDPTVRIPPRQATRTPGRSARPAIGRRRPASPAPRSGRQ